MEQEAVEPTPPPKPKDEVSPSKRLRPPRPPRSADEPGADLVTFDVGGSVFRCKLRLLEKVPNARLHRLAVCGCSTTAANSIFLDRNPALFAIILDWYRTGEVQLPDHVSRRAVETEASYFDVGAEMFPMEAPRHKVVCFAKALTHVLSPSQAPLVYVLRAHEQLVLETAAGSGRLFLRVTDLGGVTTVPQAVLYDSDSYFFLGGGAAKLHGTPFPGSLIYSFWVEARGTTTAITITLQLRSVFSPSEQLQLSAADEAVLHDTIEVIEREPHCVTTTTLHAVVAASKTAVQNTSPLRTPGASLPEITKERAQILEEAQLFQAKVREHAPNNKQ
ncbi:hypothetical protein ACHHYP_04937 [Achlya hypogyna]|uniref:Potassium channel tetramerisation-type BTB domain-containing protein n=1 Tax=Achlya hypogyna TaxID=1202772 RepID=A0A1V9ZNX1_ACHHY|nr:hypothetical protein ACHHYP_04937 [Achlya hypogyna]